MYLHQRRNWTDFTWDEEKVFPKLSEVRFKQGQILGAMSQIGFDLQNEAMLQTLTSDVLKSSEIEGELLDSDEVRSSIARRLGLKIEHSVPSDRNVDGVVEMLVEASQNYEAVLTRERLFEWHTMLFPSGRSGATKIVVGNWRNNPKDDPMRVISGAIGREVIHFVAPDSERIDAEIQIFLSWFNQPVDIDPLLKSAIAHFWFVTIHPFEDGNGRISRAIADMQLCRADKTGQRFYSMSAQIRQERKVYYNILERTQSGDGDITDWLLWYLACLERAIDATKILLESVFRKAKLWEMPVARTFNERQRAMLNKLLENFDGKLTSSKWAKMMKCSQDTASRDIQDLIHKGILEKDFAGGRSTNYLLTF